MSCSLVITVPTLIVADVPISTYVTGHRDLAKVHPSLQVIFFSTFSKKCHQKQSKTGVPMMLVPLANPTLGGSFLGTPKIQASNCR